LSAITLVYFSNYSGNTKRFMEKLNGHHTRIPINYGDINSGGDIVMDHDYVICIPTYGGGSEKSAIPRQVRHFLNNRQNRERLRGVIGFGNTNFGEHFCKAADLISQKTGVPIVARVEIFGTDYDVEQVKKRLEILYGQ
jgi:protein involved in ribonucleotide reduction